MNRLVVTPKGEEESSRLDAKITFGSNALFRHTDVEALRDEGEEDPAELRAGRPG